MSEASTPSDSPPAWVADAVFYQIFPERFARSRQLRKPGNLEEWDSPPTRHGYKGGDLVGVVERLDWLTELGINSIYFNPIFRSASNHRYHTHDYYQVDPLLGGNEAFRTLLDACHQRGIRVILDGVFNHASRGFFQFNDILENGYGSPWVDWFTITGSPLNPYHQELPPNYQAWWGNPALPKFNTDHPDVREYLMGVAEHWTRQGIDGWRLDVPSEITTPGFWEEFRSRVRAINPQAYLVGEIWADATDWIARGDRFDAAMNYIFTGKTLAFVAGHRIDAGLAEGVDYPVKPAIDAGQYGDAIEWLLSRYPEQTTRSNLNLLGSHDTARSLTMAGGDVDSVVLAALLMFTFPGAPCVYYGDEIGMTGGKDPESRGAFPWDRPESWNTRILEAYRRLSALRHAHPALRHGSYRRLSSQTGSSLYMFLRETPEERLLIAVNANEEAASASIREPYPGRQFETLWGTGGIKTDGNWMSIALPPRCGVVWRVEH
ncbi:MAG TPA: glycoside hydrolase family 13 protein [Acidimicrobiia bacterium]|nr:glycoside hydrolase family 13 protein [Acidimicrobiia bacterium]